MKTEVIGLRLGHPVHLDHAGERSGGEGGQLDRGVHRLGHLKGAEIMTVHVARGQSIKFRVAEIDGLIGKHCRAVPGAQIDDVAESDQVISPDDAELALIGIEGKAVADKGGVENGIITGGIAKRVRIFSDTVGSGPDELDEVAAEEHDVALQKSGAVGIEDAGGRHGFKSTRRSGEGQRPQHQDDKQDGKELAFHLVSPSDK